MTITLHIGELFPIIARQSKPDHWLMFIEGDTCPYDEIFTSDLFGMIDLCLRPVA